MKPTHGKSILTTWRRTLLKNILMNLRYRILFLDLDLVSAGVFAVAAEFGALAEVYG
jgi:hypothetical protein